jgi:hypothetical protein
MPRTHRAARIKPKLESCGPVSEMSTAELHEEKSRLEGFARFTRGAEIHAELFKRFQTRKATGQPFTGAEVTQWAKWLDYDMTDPLMAAHFRRQWCGRQEESQ